MVKSQKLGPRKIKWFVQDYLACNQWSEDQKLNFQVHISYAMKCFSSIGIYHDNKIIWK